MREYNIAVLKGDGIGPEIVNEAIRVLDKAGEKFGFHMNYTYALLGGCAIDETGVPLPQETIDACKAADSTLLGAVGGPKWDNVPAIAARRRACSVSAERSACSRTCARPSSSRSCAALPRCARRSSARAWISWWCAS